MADKIIRFGKSDLYVSRIALGCWQAGKFGWGDVKDEDIINGILTGFDIGINFIDTADIYGFGYSEELVGKAIKLRKRERDKIVIATKVGLNWPRTKNKDALSVSDIFRDLSPKYIVRAVEESLRRIGIDYIDLYQCHWPDPKTPLEKIVETMEKLCEEGKVRWWGVSNFSVSDMQKIVYMNPKYFVSDQPPFSLIERHTEKEILPFAKKNGIALMVYSPLGMGILTGKYKNPPKFKDFDWRNYNQYFTDEKKFQKVIQSIEKSYHIARKYGVEFGQIAIAWVLAKGADVAICGFKNPKQVQKNAKALEIELSEDEVKELDENFAFALVE